MNQFFLAYKSPNGKEGFRLFSSLSNTHEEISALIVEVLNRIGEEINESNLIATSFNKI